MSDATRLEIDGSRGEGGGQVLRSSLGLAAVTGRPFRIRNIRAGRRKPGLLRQHLVAARAAAAVTGGSLEGDRLGSTELEFWPGAARPGSYDFQVGSAGSATLVLQTILPPLMLAQGPSTVTLEGGTHNPWAPPFDHLARAFLPLLERLGPRVRATLERPGFFPAGGGRFRVEVEPVRELRRVELLERGEVRARSGVAVVAHLPAGIARRELKVLGRELGWSGAHLRVDVREDSLGPGNVIVVEVACEHVTEVFTGFGRKGLRAEAVAQGVAEEVRAYLDAGVPVGEHLADQLLLPMALAGGGRFRSVEPSKHTRTQFDAFRDFLDLDGWVEDLGGGVWEVGVGRR